MRRRKWASCRESRWTTKVTGRVLGEIGLKLWAVVMMSYALAALPALFVTFATEDVSFRDSLGARMIVGSLGPVLIGLALLVWGRKIAFFLFPDTPKLQIQFGANDLIVLVLVLAGVYWLINGVVLLAQLLTEYYFRPSKDTAFWDPWSREILVQSLTYFATGFVLVSRRASISRALLRSRSPVEL